MKAIAVERGGNRPVVVERERPEPAAGEALVRTLRVGVDGTDHEVLEGSHGGPPAGAEHFVLGHEAVGVVVDPNDTELEEGDVVVPTVRRPPASGTNEYFEKNQPDMAPDGMYAERGIVGAHGFMSEYFTSPSNYLVRIPRSQAELGFLIEPISITEKAREQAYASRSAFDWNPSSALVLGNGSLGLLTLAMLKADDKGYESLYCLGRRDRPDPTIDVIEKLGATYVDSRETPVEEVPSAHEGMDFIYEATGFPKHAIQSVQALAPNGVAALLGVPSDWKFEVDAGAFHREMVLHNKALVGSVNSHVKHFEAATVTFTKLPRWFLRDLVTGVHPLSEFEAAFEDDDTTIKTAIEFGTV